MTSPCFLYNFAKENIRIPFNLGSVIKLSNQPKKETTHSISKFQFWSTWKSEDKLSKQKAKDCQVLALWKLYAGWKRMQILQNRLNSITSRRYCKSNQQFLPAIDSFFLNCFIALRFMQVYSTHEKKNMKKFPLHRIMWVFICIRTCAPVYRPVCSGPLFSFYMALRAWCLQNTVQTTILNNPWRKHRP